MVVVVVAAEVGVDPPIRRRLPCSGGLGCVAVVAESGFGSVVCGGGVVFGVG